MAIPNSPPSEPNLFGLTDQLPDGIVTTDTEGKVAYCNPAFEQLLCLKSEDVIGKPLAEVLALSKFTNVDYFRGLLKEILAGEKISSVKMESQCEDGKPRHSEIRILPAKKDGAIVGTQVIVTDITEHEQAEKKLEEKTNHFEKLFENASVGSLMTGPDGKLIKINPTFCKMLGYSQHELENKTFQDITHPDDISIGTSLLRQVANGEIDQTVQEKRYLRKDGEIVWAQANISTVRDANGKVQFFVTHVLDISEHKQKETELLTMAEMLDSAPNSITIHGFDGKFMYANQRTLEIHGYDRDEFTALNLSQLDAPATAELIEERMKILQEKGETRFEVTHIHKDQTEIPMEVLVKTVKYKGTHALLSIATDITERKKTEESNKELHQLNEQIINATQGIIVYDRDLLYKVWNPFMERLTGIPASEVLGKSPLELFPFLREGGVIERLNRALAGKETETVEFPYHLPDGKSGWTSDVSVPLKNVKGEIIGVLGSVQDITERKRAEEALRESEKKFRKLFENMVEGVALHEMVYDSEGKPVDYRILDVNPAYQKHTSIPADLSKNALASQLYGTGEVPFLDVYYGVASTGISTSFETFFETLDKHFRVSVFSPGKDKFATVFENITGQKKIAEELKRNEDRYRTLFENSRDSLMTLEPPSWRFTSGNPATLALFGAKSQEEFEFHPPWELSPEFQPDGRPSADKAKEMIETAIRSGSHYFEWTHKRLNGEEFPATVLLTRLEIDGKMTVQATVRDITEHKKFEKALHESERLQAAGETAAGVAHDFNNALQGIIGGIDIALFDSTLSADVRKRLESTKQLALDVSSRIRQIQRITGKSYENAEYEDVDIKSVAEDAIAQTRSLWHDKALEKGLDIDVKLNCPNDLTMLGNSGELRSTLFNLIKNSVEAMPEGGTITIDSKKKKGDIVLTITDTGIGMDENTKQKVFHPFFTTKGFEQGRGMGMSGVYTTIKEHKGIIEVKKTAPGQGTTIEIRLPFAKKKQASKTESSAEIEKPIKILWVDDEPIITETWEVMIKMLGQEIDTAGSGQEALKLLEAGSYDLMISDVGMPGMSGYQLAEKIKGKYPDMKIAIVTGWGDTISAEEKKERGLGYVISKPIVIAQIENLIREAAQMKKK